MAMHVDIISDTICPWCYIGKRRFDRARANRPEIELEIEWRAFQLNPDMPPEGMDREMYLVEKFGSPEQARDIYQRVSEAGASEGIPFAFERIATTPNTVASHRLIRWSGELGLQDALVTALFEAYFENGANIGDFEVLADIAASAGLEREDVVSFLASGAEESDIQAECRAANMMGIHGVPCFIFDRKYAVSGAHEPEVFERAFDLALQGDGEADQAGEAPDTTLND